VARSADPVTAYARAVVARKIVAGPYVRLACARHLKDVKDQKKTRMLWRPDVALKSIEFFPDVLTLEEEDAFKPLPWQCFVIGSLRGWFRHDGFRRFRDAYIETGKGSGKTPLAAGLALQAFVTDKQAAAEVYSAATTTDQAKIAWTDADRMVEMSPELNAVVKREAACLSYGSPERVFRPVSSEHKGLDGKRPHFVIVDELHEHPSDMVVNKMKAGTKRNRNALIFRITNSGFDRNSVCWKEHDYSIKVLQGTLKNEAWFAYICALDKGDDWTDEAVWPKANPGMHAGLPPVEYLRDQIINAVGMPSKENIVKRLNCCIWTEASELWLRMDKWDACPSDKISTQALLGESCIMGLDMASTEDFSASAKLFGPDEDGFYDVLWRFWLPEESIAEATSKRPEAVRLQLREWADQGWITLTPGQTTDYDLIEEALLDDAAKYNVKSVPFDRWNVTQLVTHLKDKLGEERVLDFSQAMAAMSAPSKELEKIVVEGKLRHGGNPVARWMASNVVIKHGPNAQIKPDREKSADKIDGIIALVMALDMAMRAPKPEASPYSERGLIFI